MMSIDRTTAFKSPYESVLPTTNSSKVSSKQQPEGVKDSMQSPKKGKSKPNLSIEMEEGSDQVSNASPSKDETASLIMLPSPTLSSPGKDISLFEKSSPDHTASVAPLSGIQEDNEENNEEMAAVSKYVDTTNKGWIKHEGTEKITAASADPRTALDTIHSWLRTLSLFDSPFLEFAEVWDIPPTQFNSYTVKTNLPSARVMLYIVDPSMEDQDIMSIKMQYSDNIKQLADHRQQQLDAGSAEADLVNAIHIVVILSSNIPSMQSQNQVEDRHYASRVADLLLWARRLGSLWFHVNIESEDDYYSFTKQLMILMKEK